jgi:hypothetical protein
MNKRPVIVEVGGGGCVTSGVPGCAVAELMAEMSRTATNWRSRRSIVSIWVETGPRKELGVWWCRTVVPVVFDER